MTIRFDRALLFTLIPAMLIAALAPFDRLLDAASLGRMDGRVALVAVLTLVGAGLAQRLGLRLTGHGARSPFLLGMGFALAMAVWVIAIDVYWYRARLDPDYLAFLHQPLAGRLVYYMPRAFLENVLYRLFLFTLLASLVLRLVPSRRWSWGALVMAMVAAQCVNIGVNVVLLSPGPVSLAGLTYDALRYVVPGVVWAILFVRNGFFTAEVASVGCHLFLQPAFSLLLGPG